MYMYICILGLNPVVSSRVGVGLGNRCVLFDLNLYDLNNCLNIELHNMSVFHRNKWVFSVDHH